MANEELREDEVGVPACFVEARFASLANGMDIRAIGEKDLGEADAPHRGRDH